jgi:hypothetical protein
MRRRIDWPNRIILGLSVGIGLAVANLIDHGSFSRSMVIVLLIAVPTWAFLYYRYGRRPIWR